MNMTPFEFGQFVKVSMQKRAVIEGIGGLAGMATAPKGQEDLAIGRGALRGIGGAIGGISGGSLGGIGGAGLGAVLGALFPRANRQPWQGQTYAGEGMGLGAVLGGLAGAGYGGYRGNKATKALLDKVAPLDDDDDKKKNKKDNDKTA